MYNTFISILLSLYSVVADPGIPRRDGGRVGDANPIDGRKNLLFGKIFAKKLHGNERNRTVGGNVSLAPPFDRPIKS